MSRRIGVVTVGRSDYGLYVPILAKIQAQPELDLQLIVSGTHLSDVFGRTVALIESDGFPISDRVENSQDSDSPMAIAKSMGVGTARFAEIFAKKRPDILVVLGDRFEMHAAAVAAQPFKIPLAHIHGGEITEGAFDDALRHSMTKLSHLHFVSAEPYARRVTQMGEEPWRVTVSGAPGLDNLRGISLLSPAELARRYSIRLVPAPLLVTFHPVTLEYERTDWQIDELLGALRETCMPVVFTLPNADTNGIAILRKIRAFASANPDASLIDNLGTQAYFSMMAACAAMVGNSSSGIIEAASFKLPVVNIGSRQEGRIRAKNVIDVGCTREEILNGIRQAVDPGFRSGLGDLKNPYGDGHAGEIILEKLKSIPIDDRLIRKRFIDV